jgi:hypothetical protein
MKKNSQKTLITRTLIIRSCILAICMVVLIFLLRIHSYLSITRMIDADTLIVESWIPDEAILFTPGLNIPSYKCVLLVGFAEREKGKNLSNTASHRRILQRMGVNDSIIHTIIIPMIEDKRTLSLALSVKQWICINGPLRKTGCNMLSKGVHARKSYIIYRRVLKGVCPIGIIASRPSEYNPEWWWLSLTGWQWVIFDTIKTIRAFILGY